jgi:hypothetical protein
MTLTGGPRAVDVAVAISLGVIEAVVAAERRTRARLDPLVRVALWRPVSRLADRLVPAVVSELLRRVDVNGIVAAVDLDRAASRLDVDAIARRVDIQAVLDRLDLTTVVLERVDLDMLVEAVIRRIDLVGLTEGVIDEIDLPGLIRESTGSMASATVLGARMQGIAADEAVGRVVDRLLLRRHGRANVGAPSPDDAPERPVAAVIPRAGMPIRP